MFNQQGFLGNAKNILVTSLVFLCSWPLMAQLNDELVHQSVVRIEVKKDQQTGMASGFVWQQKDWVITALHAMRQNAKITVICGDIPYPASIIKILKDADLVLLKTEAELSKCAPLNQMDPEKPKARSELVAFGYKPSVKSSTAKNLKKASASNETLKNLISENMRLPMQKLGLPSIELPVYYVTGGIYKGFSGGPVMDVKGKLIGIVEGGLDKGTSDHNWLIPASNIDRLIATAPVTVVPFDIDDKTHYFSSVVTKEAAPDDFIQFNFAGVDYDWMKTKTRSFEKLLYTSMPAQGLDELWASIIPEIETSAEQNLAFDIYEEEQLGLIIAIPKGIKLQYQLEEYEGEQDWSLVAQDSSNKQAMISIKHGDYVFTDDAGQAVLPSHANYFDYELDEALSICEEHNISCEVLDEHFRIVDFGQGNRILRVSYIIADQDNNSSELVYKSVVVKGEQVLIVETSLNLGIDSAFIKCFERATKKACGTSYWESASFILATALTSFSNLAVDNIEPNIIKFDYDCQNCNPSDDNELSHDTNQSMPVEQNEPMPNYQASVIYFDENNQQLFSFTQLNGWLANLSNSLYPAELLEQVVWPDEKEYAILAIDDILFAVPLQGGEYYIQAEDESWQNAGVILPSYSE